MLACTSRVGAVLLAGALVVASSACKKDEKKDDDDFALLAEDGTDANTAETDTEVVTSSLVSAAARGGTLTLASTGELAVDDGTSTRGVGDGAKALYAFPRNCLAVTADEAARTVTYNFADCMGPNGIMKIRGVIVATYESLPGKLILNLVGNDLRINKAVVDWSATAEITTDGTSRSMHWKGSLSGVTARGKEFTRTNEKSVSWRLGERCFALAGVSEGMVRGRYLRTEIADFRRCQGACPEAGGRITVSNEAKQKIEIRYDGTNRATFTSPRGTTTFGLACAGSG